LLLIGDRELVRNAVQLREDFRKIFKVRVEFDEEMTMSDGGHRRNMHGRLRRLFGKRDALSLIVGHSPPCWNTLCGKPAGVTKSPHASLDIADWPARRIYAAAAANETVGARRPVRAALASKWNGTT